MLMTILMLRILITSQHYTFFLRSISNDFGHSGYFVERILFPSLHLCSWVSIIYLVNCTLWTTTYGFPVLVRIMFLK